jgi:hypothetical protein
VDPLGGKLSEGRRTSGPVHQTYHGSQDHQEYQDAHIIAVGQDADDACLKNMGDGFLKLETGVEKASHENPHKQGAVDLLGDEGQADGHYGRDQGPEGGIDGRFIDGLTL